MNISMNIHIYEAVSHQKTRHIGRSSC